MFFINQNCIQVLVFAISIFKLAKSDCQKHFDLIMSFLRIILFVAKNGCTIPCFTVNVIKTMGSLLIIISQLRRTVYLAIKARPNDFLE